MKWLVIGICVLFVSGTFSEVTYSAVTMDDNSRNGPDGNGPDIVAQSLDPNGTEVFSLSTTEDITVLSNGDADVTISTIVPSSPLADLYRDALGAPSNASIGKTMPIPEEKTLYGTLNISNEVGVGEANVTKMDIPVREQFYGSMAQDQLFLLGFPVTFVDSQMMPRGTNNEMRFSLDAYIEGFAEEEFVRNMETEPGRTWEIYVGPVDENSTSVAMGYLLTQMRFMQGYLASMAGDQAYYYEWDIAIELPAGATILNEEALSALGWQLYFGEDTYIEALVSVEEEAVSLQQLIVVGESDFLITSEQLFEALSAFRVFKIEYQMNSEKEGIYPQDPFLDVEQASSARETDWEFPWSHTISPGELSLNLGPAKITITPSLTVSGYIGWDFYWFWLQYFEAWMKFEPSITVKMEASVSASYSNTWEKQLLNWNLARFSFTIGFVPVWADLDFSATLKLQFSAEGKITFEAMTFASVWFKCGVRWTKDYGWENIDETGVNPCTLDGPHISAEASATLRPSFPLRLKLMFYSLAGPYVEFEPYGLGTVTFRLPPNPSSWKVRIGAAINAGVTFAGFLKKLLGLEDYGFEIYDWLWKEWSDEIVPPPPQIPPTPANLTIKRVNPECGTVTHDRPRLTNIVVANVTAHPKNPMEDCKFARWILDGVEHNKNPTMKVELDGKDRELIAEFRPSLDISVNNENAGYTEPYMGKNWSTAINQKKSVLAKTRGDSKFLHWNLDGVKVSTSNPYDVTMDQHHDLEAVFEYVPTYDIGVINATCRLTMATVSSFLQETKPKKNKPTLEIYQGANVLVSVDYWYGNFGTEDEEFKATVLFNKIPMNEANGSISIGQKNLKRTPSPEVNTKSLNPGTYNVTVDLALTMHNHIDKNLTNNTHWAGTVVIKGKSKINLTLLHPLDRYVYLFGFPFMPFPPDYHPEVHVTIQLGPALLTATAESEAGIEKVGFSIDGGTAHWDYIPPYIYFWLPPFGIGLHTVEVIAYDNTGSSATKAQDVITVWFLPGGEYGPG